MTNATFVIPAIAGMTCKCALKGAELAWKDSRQPLTPDSPGAWRILAAGLLRGAVMHCPAVWCNRVVMGVTVTH